VGMCASRIELIWAVGEAEYFLARGWQDFAGLTDLPVG
jgi:hypothetical protein